MADVQPRRPHNYLRRLDAGRYRGQSFVHWSMTVADRRAGWLDAAAHVCWREVLLHALHRYRLAAPVYCLMPDHVHLLLVGLSDASEQRHAVAFLRRYTAPMFAAIGGEWQKQGFDHVLREEERERGAFVAIASYIAENPVRAGLCERAEQWAYSSSLVAGSPGLDWRREDFWARFWIIYNEAVEHDDEAGT